MIIPVRNNPRLVGLGRLKEHDPKSKDYPMPRLRTAVKRAERDYSSWNMGTLEIDQGNTPRCVGYSGKRLLVAGPITNRDPSIDPDDCYFGAQTWDEWPGAEYDGSSVNGFMKYARNTLGVIKEWRWAFSEEILFNNVLLISPAQVGTVWDAELSNPDGDGYIAPGKNIEKSDEGHAWVLGNAYRNRHNPDGTVGAYRMWQNWGFGWGERGKAWITRKSVAILLAIEGEAAMALEQKLKAH